MAKKKPTYHSQLPIVHDFLLAEFFLERERVQIIAQAAVYTFFLYILVGLVGLIKSFFSIQDFMVLLIMGVSILLIANYPYLKVIKKEVEYLRKLDGQKKSESSSKKKNT